ncbi:MAG: radical SAM/SPASM domain-containing protein [Planctomycetaceae bacterium]
MPDFLDPSIERKSKIVDQTLELSSNGLPLPSVVEISESGTCNRACAFCPRSAPSFPDVKEFISADLIDKVSTQLNDVGYQGIVLFSGFVEPLLDVEIFNHLKLFNQNTPNARLELVTNGDVLDEKCLARLFESGLSTLLISVYDGPEDVDRFRRMCDAAGLKEDQYVIRNRYLPPEDNFGITLSNRGGMMEEAEHKIESAKSPIELSCYYPHYTFFMDYLGDVLMCPHDWGKKHIVGNLFNNDFLEIWNGILINAARKRLANGDRAFSPCDTCDVKGTLMGRQHFFAWQKYNQL